MDYEKKYNNVVNKFAYLLESTDLIKGELRQDIESIFPELKESEDERMVKFIKKQLFNIKKTITENYELDAKLTKAIDWLEKQGNLMKALQISNAEIGELIEKNYYLKEQLEKQGENNMGISEATKQKLEDNLNEALEKETPESCNEFLDEQGEQKPWSEEDEAIYYGVIETEQYMLDVVNGIKKFNVGNISIKEECTRELNWLKSLKDKCLPQPKQEWSEEDETVLNNLIYALANDRIGNNRDEYVDWLKSLRPQKHWKPSDEQMDMLAKMCSTLHLTYGENEIMESIYDALKKLKEIKL